MLALVSSLLPISPVSFSAVVATALDAMSSVSFSVVLGTGLTPVSAVTSSLASTDLIFSFLLDVVDFVGEDFHFCKSSVDLVFECGEEPPSACTRW